MGSLPGRKSACGKPPAKLPTSLFYPRSLCASLGLSGPFWAQLGATRAPLAAARAPLAAARAAPAVLAAAWGDLGGSGGSSGGSGGSGRCSLFLCLSDGTGGPFGALGARTFVWLVLGFASGGANLVLGCFGVRMWGCEPGFGGFLVRSKNIERGVCPGLGPGSVGIERSSRRCLLPWQRRHRTDPCDWDMYACEWASACASALRARAHTRMLTRTRRRARARARVHMSKHTLTHEAWGGFGKAWGMLGECFQEAWGGLFYPRSASLGKLAWEASSIHTRLGEAWGMLGDASGRLGAGLGNA